LELRERVEERTLELREAHQQLLRSEKAAATGTFSAGVASEMTDPLTSVLGIIQLLVGRARKDPTRSRDVELLESAEQEALRIRAVVSRVRTLAQRQSELQFAPVRVNDLVDSTLEMLNSDFDAGGIEVVRAYGKELPAARGNFTQLQQALLQVLSNSVNARGEDARIVVSTLLTDSGMLRIVVADNGCGIVEHDVDRIFEPFFTTGDASAGAGLGLSIAQRIIEEHHGTIGATSTRGEGTVVSIALPLATPEASASES
jgi:signal transduction histidine kinase